MIANIVGPDGVIVLILVLVVIFGGSQLPKLARNVGAAGKEFRKAQQEAEEEAQRKAAARSAPTDTPAPPAVGTGSPDDQVTLSRADLEALLDERAKRQAGPAA